MIGKKSLILIRKLFEITAILRFTTFRWDKDAFALYSDNPITSICGIYEVNRLGWKITNTMNLLVLPYSLIRTLYGALVLEQASQDIVFQLYVINVYIFAGNVCICNWIRNDPIPYLFTLFVRFERMLTEKYQSKRVQDVSFPYLLIIGVLGFGLVPGLVILYLLNYKKPVYLGSLIEYIPHEFQLIRILAFFLFLVIETILAIGCVSNILSYVFLYIIYWKTSEQWLKEMTVGGDVNLRVKVTNDAMRTPYNVTKIFRQWQINFIVLNTTTDFVLCSQHYMTASLLVLCSFATIEYWGAHNWVSIASFISYIIYPVASMILVVWIIMILPIGANIKVQSHKFKFFWKNYIQKSEMNEQYYFESKQILTNKQLHKIIRSCNELEVQIGTFFSYNKSNMPQTLDICVDKTITLLVGI